MNERKPVPALLMVAAMVALAGCGGGAPQEPIRICPEYPGVTRSSDSFTFVLTETVEPRNVPMPMNDSEAILFALAYPGLVETDCEGGALPAVAATWTGSTADSSWTFRFGDGAMFSDGVPLTADLAEQIWMSRSRAGHLVAPWIWDHVNEEGIEVLGPDRLLVHAPNAYSDLLAALTQPTLAFARANRHGTWALGTRGALESPRPGEQHDVSEAVWTPGGKAYSTASEISFRVMKDAEPAEIVAAGADVFFVRSKAALAYVEQLPGYDVTPFPYSRLYVLLTPEPDVVHKIDEKDVESLLPDTVGDARVAENAEGYRTEAPESRERLPRAADKIVVPWWDRDAHAVARRLSAVWRERSDRAHPVILPKKRGEFFQHVLEGKEALYVFPVYPLLPTKELQQLHVMRSAPWLAERGGSVPLFETRGHLVTREGLAGIDSGYDGFPRLHEAGWAGTPAVP